MIDLLVPFLVFFSIMMIGAGILSLHAVRRKPTQKRLRELEKQLLPSQSTRLKPTLMSLLRRFGKKSTPGAPSRTLRDELAKGGFYGNSAPAIYMGFKHTLLVLGLVGGAGFLFLENLSFSVRVILMITSAIALYFLPNIYVQVRQRKRTTRVRRYLPDMVDLLEICVASGMGLDTAWNCVADEIRRVSTILADEMALTNLEIHLGASRSAAMRHMGERTRVDELSSLVALLVQSDRFGTSVGDALKVFAQSMREERSQRTQEAAEKMAVKLLFPMVLFVFPAVLIVMVGPAAIELFKVITER